MKIMSLEPQQKKLAARVVAGAFYDYPSFGFYFPDPKRRKRWLKWYMERVLNTALKFGEVHVTDDLSGVLFALPPDHLRLTDWDYVKCGFLFAPLVVGLRQFQKNSECEKYVADTQEKLMKGRPHFYLWGLSADPMRQHTGAGTALLASFLKKTDALKMPVYLETHKQQNVAYYQSRGFTLVHTDTVPKHNLTFWCMLHEPSQT